MRNLVTCPHGCSTQQHVLRRCTCKVKAPYALMEPKESVRVTKKKQEEKKGADVSAKQNPYHWSSRVKEQDGKLWFY